MKKLIALTLALVLALSLAACGGGNSGSNGGTSDGGTKTSTATDKWPSGVYNPLNVPEYKVGKVVYATPESEEGSVYLKTTREEMLAYIEQLKSAGFRPESTLEQNLTDHQTWSNFTMYFPKSGGKYALEIGYWFDNDGEGISEEFYMSEEDEEPTKLFFNLSIRLSDHGMGDSITQKDLLTSIGLPDSAVIPKGTVSMDAEMANPAPAFYIYSFEPAFDFEITKEYFHEYANGLIDACAAAAEGGMLKGLGKEADAATAKAEEWSSWQYSYQGKNYMIMLTSEEGFESEINVMVQETK